MTTANNRRLQTVQLGTPSPKQDMFLRCHCKYIGYGGARGGGKSWAVRVKAILLAQRFPGIHMLIVRRTYKELEGNHIRTLRAMTRGFAVYNSTEKLLTFSNGSTIEFMYCARDADLDKLQGLEYDVIFLDEATQLSEYQMRTITATLRGVNDFPKRVYYTCNPGGQGHQYIKRLFIDKQYKPNENPQEYAFIQALVDDNKALMESQPDYLAQLEEYYLEIELIRQFYTEPRTFRIDDGSGRYEYMDYSNVNIAPQDITTPEGTRHKKSIFDLEVSAEKQSPFSRASQNETAKELYQMGLFAPDNATSALVCLDMMEFEGKEKIKQQIQQNDTFMQQFQQMQQLIIQLSPEAAVQMGLVDPNQVMMPQNANNGAPGVSEEGSAEDRAAKKTTNTDRLDRARETARSASEVK